MHAGNLQVVPGELTVVTGVPNSGKSEWLDALLVNLALRNGWQFAMCSMEKAVSACIPRLLFPCLIFAADREHSASLWAEMG